MNEYIQMIHDIIDKVNPSVYVDTYPKQLAYFLIGIFIVFLFGVLLFCIRPLTKRIKIIDDDAISTIASVCIVGSLFGLLAWSQSSRPPIKDTLDDPSKTQISEYVGHLSNDDYITLQKYVTSYGQQVDLPTEQERAVNNRLIELFK